jgi:hypothetical protein
VGLCVAAEEGASGGGLLSRLLAPKVTVHALTSPEDAGGVSGTLFHYTDEAGRAAIQLSGRILPREEGAVYFEVPTSSIEDLQGPSVVGEWPPGAGNGGGTEYWATRPIPADGLRWVGF